MGVRGQLAWLAAATVMLLGAWAAPAGAHVYWTDFGTNAMGRANLDGSGATQSFIPGVSNSYGIAVDGEHVYWTNGNTGAIGRANLDGSGANQNFITGASRPGGVAVDGAHVYWTNLNTGTIGRANLDGSGADENFISGTDESYGVAVTARHVYWTNLNAHTIGRANLDGSDADQSFITGARYPVGITTDGQHVFWTNADAIGRADLDGSDADQDFISGVPFVVAVAVDGRHVYWTNNVTDRIGRANLDGSDADESFITSVRYPGGLAVDGGPAGTASASATGLAFGTHPLGVFGAPQTLTITNTGHGNLQIGTARVAAGELDDFLVSYDDCSHTTLTIGGSCTIHVRFGPSGGGDRRATLAVTSDDSASPLQIALTGTAGELPQGPAGAAGPAGAQGLAGSPGAVLLVSCRTVKRHGDRVRRRHCTTRLISGTATFTIPACAHASLTRRHVVFATGIARHARLVLHARRRLPAGRYTLTLRYRRHGHLTVTRMPVTITELRAGRSGGM